MARLAAAQDGLVEMARKLGAADNEIAALRAQVDDVRAARDDARAERDRWAGIAEASQQQITHLAERLALAPPARRSWWLWRRAS